MDNLYITVQILQALLVVYVCWYFLTVKYYIRRKSIGMLGEYTVYYGNEKPEVSSSLTPQPDKSIVFY